MATLTPVLGNSQRLDGGAMFGNAPRELWRRWVEPDEHNRIALATRALLVQERSGRNVLFEAGVGAFFDPASRERYGVVEERHVLLDGLAALGVDAADIDVVVLSHLHFDHAGGVMTAWEAQRPPALVFPGAAYVVSRAAWERASAPTPRDRASFVPELPGLLEATGRVELVDDDTSSTLGPGYRFHRSDGHTPGLLMAEISTPSGPVVYPSDLVPGRPWLQAAITMGYDRHAELVVEEKAQLLEDLLARDALVVFTHDPDVAVARLRRDDRGRVVAAPSGL